MQHEASEQATIRFEAELAGVKEGACDPVSELGLDRVPGPNRTMRVLLTPEEAARLLDRGISVRLLRAHKVAPLDPKLIMTDEAAESELRERTRGLTRQEGQ